MTSDTTLTNVSPAYKQLGPGPAEAAQTENQRTRQDEVSSDHRKVAQCLLKVIHISSLVTVSNNCLSSSTLFSAIESWKFTVDFGDWRFIYLALGIQEEQQF